MNYNVPLDSRSIAWGEWRYYTCIKFSDYLKKSMLKTYQWLWADVVILVSNYTRSVLLDTCTFAPNTTKYIYSRVTHVSKCILWYLVQMYIVCVSVWICVHTDVISIIAWKWHQTRIRKVHRAKFPVVYVWGSTSLVFLSPCKANLWNLWRKIKIHSYFPHIRAQSAHS